MSDRHLAGGTAEEEEPPHEAVELIERIRSGQAFASTWSDETQLTKPCTDQESILVEEKSKGFKTSEKIAVATIEVIAPEMQDSDSDMLAKVMPRKNRITLSTALKGHDTWESAADDLWRLLCYLRVGPEGADSKVVPNHFLSRGRISKNIKKWQNVVRHEIALLNAHEAKGAAKKQSRDSAWIQHVEKLRCEHAAGLPSSLAIESGDLVAAWWVGRWHVGLVLSVWRYFKRGTGSAQLQCHEISRGAMHSARILIMKAVEGEHQNLFVANPLCTCIVLRGASIEARLDMPDMHCKRGLDGMQVLLPEDRF